MATKKRKTAKTTKARKVPALTRAASRSVRCQPLRDQLERHDLEIANIRESLDDPDIPNRLKARLRLLLRQLLASRDRVLRALEACERIPADPRR